MVTPESAKEFFYEDYQLYLEQNPAPDFDKLAQSVVSMWRDKSESGHPDLNVDKIRTETLLMRGDNDFLVSYESLGRLQKRIKGSALANIPFAEHEVCKEQPKIVHLLIEQFLSSQ